MLLNFYTYSLYLWGFSVWLVFLFSVFLAKSGFPVFVDFFSRVNLTEFFINTYYYFWTTFWLIPTVLTVALTLSIIRLSHNLPKLLLLPILVILAFVFEVIDYAGLNNLSYVWDLNTTNVNLLLTNSINKYHPFLFYYTFISLIAVYLLFYINLNLQHDLQYNLLVSKPLRLLLLGRLVATITFTLFLGSWWALQEGSWGGWWNWDPSEVFGLFIMFVFINVMHSKLNYGKIYASWGRLKLSLVLTVTLYVFIQLNFNLVSHNFGIKVTDFINTSQLFMLMLILSLLLIHKINYRFGHFKNKLASVIYGLECSYARLNQKLIFYYLTSFITSLVFLLSFSPLILDFVSKNFGIKSLNWLLSYEILFYYLLILTSINFWTLSSLLFFTCTGFLFYYSPSLWAPSVLILLPALKYRVMKLHFIFQLTLILSILNYYNPTLEWTLSGLNFFTTPDFFELKYTQCLGFFSQSNLYLRQSILEFNNQLSLSNPTSFFHSSTSLEVPIFGLINCGGYNMQGLYASTFLKPFTIGVFDLSVNSLINIAYLCFIGANCIVWSSTIIIF